MILEYKDITSTAQMDYKNKNDTSYHRGNWNHLRITQTIPEHQALKVLRQ